MSDSTAESILLLNAKHEYQRAELALNQGIELIQWRKKNMVTKPSEMAMFQERLQRLEDIRDRALTKFIELGGELDF